MRSKPPIHFAMLLAALFALVPAQALGARAAPQYKALYNFTGGSDGGEPFGLVEDAAGNLYGTTGIGGDPNCQCGTVFKLDKAGRLTVLHTFANGSDGAFPYATLALSENMLYGAANSGGAVNCYYGSGCGLLFQINIQSSAFRVIHIFNIYDGLYPSGALTLRSGVLYGTTLLGGTSMSCYYGCGVVYKLVLKTGAFTVLHSFDNSDGAFPESPLTLDRAGKILYGTTPEGGSIGNGDGVAFRVDLCTGRYEVLYNFAGPPDAQYPYGPLTMDSRGNLYGDSQLGGSYPCGGHGCGTVFMLNPATKADTVLYNLAGGPDGNYPMAGITRTWVGAVYGATAWGGLNDDGTVFELVEGTETVLHSFEGSDGAHPFAAVVMDPNGNLFGTTLNGGSYSGECSSYGCGVVWEITP
jgi:uncharacterized repeat protein (TIGR03803 family)